MQFNNQVIVHGIKESAGDFEGKAFSSTTFHCEVDLKENGAGRSLGRVTRPFKIGDAAEFEKWVHLAASFPLKADAVFEMVAARDDKSELKLISIAPVARASAPAQASKAA